jgi:hypothetical protein
MFEKNTNPEYALPVEKSLAKLWFVVVAYLQQNRKPYLCIVSDDANKKQLRLDGQGSMQVKEGNSWRLVMRTTTFLLDEESVQAVASFIKEAEREKGIRLESKIIDTDTRPKTELELKLGSYGLVEADMYGSFPAQRLMDRVYANASGNKLDIRKPKDLKEFYDEWVSQVRILPLPFVPPQLKFNQLYPGKLYPTDVDPEQGNFAYLHLLTDRKIVDNIRELPQGDAVHKPRFASGMNLFMMDWHEQDVRKIDGSGRPFLETVGANSALLRSLGWGSSGIVMSRPEIDDLLWEGDVDLQEPTKRHRQIIEDLNFDPRNYRLRLIDAGEYARLAVKQKWGEESMATHFDGYAVVDVSQDKKERRGLCGGDVRDGGSSHISWVQRSDVRLPVRLVLARV